MSKSLPVALSATLSLILANGGGVAPAQAQLPPQFYTQCVKNVIGKSGIIARVKWYNANEVTFIKPDPRGDNADTTDIDESLGQLKVGFAKPTKEQVIPVAQQSCVGGLKSVNAPQIAIVSVVGGKFAAEAVKLGINTLAAGVGLLSCPATAGAGCAAALAIASGGANAAASMAALGIPEAKEVFYIGFPSAVDLAGTAFNPSATETALGVAVKSYRVTVDTCMSGLKDTGTGDTLMVDFLAGGKMVARQSLKGSGSGCEFEANTSTSEVVTGVRIATTGGDGMMIDQVQLYRDGTKIVWDGRDDGNGWCLSSDVNDYVGGWEGRIAGSGCRKSWDFASPA